MFASGRLVEPSSRGVSSCSDGHEVHRFFLIRGVCFVERHHLAAQNFWGANKYGVLYNPSSKKKNSYCGVTNKGEANPQSSEGVGETP